MPIHVTTSTTQSLSNKTFVDRVSTTGVVYASSGNSNQWSSTYSSVYATSATWDSTYTSLNTNSAKYDSVYTSVNTNSAKYDSVYTSVNINSAKYDSAYTTTNAESANWDSTYNTVYTASGSWAAQTLSFNENTAILSITNGNTVSLSALSGGGSSSPGSETDPLFTTWAQANSAKYESTYTTVTGKLILGQLGIAINGGSINGAGSVITTGTKQLLRVPYDCTITSWEIVINPPGEITMGIFKSTYDTFPTSLSITGYGPPQCGQTVESVFYPEARGRSESPGGNGWNTTLTAGEYLEFRVTSVTTATAACLTLTTRR